MRRMVRYRRLLVVEIIITQRITQALTATVPHRVFSAKRLRDVSKTTKTEKIREEICRNTRRRD